MLKIDRTKVLINVLKDLEARLGLAQPIKGDEDEMTGFDIDQYHLAQHQDLFQMKSPSCNYDHSELVDSVIYQEANGGHKYGLNIPTPTEAIGWPPGIVEFIIRTVVTAIDSTLEYVYDSKEMDDNVDNILRGEDQSP